MAKRKTKRTARPMKRNNYFLLVGFAVVMFWRGAWGLMDLYLFPDQPAISFTASLILGLVIIFFTNRKKLQDLG